MDEKAIKVMLANSPQTPVSRLLALALDDNAMVRGEAVLNPRMPKRVAERLLSDEVEAVAERARIAIAIQENKTPVSQLETQLRDEIFLSLWGDEQCERMGQEAKEEEEEEEEGFPRFKEDKKPSLYYEW